MQTLKRLLKRQPLLQKQLIPKWLVIAFLVIALIGFADATYLTVEHYANAIPPCTIGGCQVVLTSAFSTIGDIPVALLGSLYYLLISLLVIIYLDAKNEKVLRAALVCTTAGFAMSVYFFVLQAFVIHSFCQYCLGSATTSTLLFISSIYIVSKFRTQEVSA